MRGAAARSRSWARAGRRGARPSTRRALAQKIGDRGSACRLVIAGVLFSIAVVDDAQTASLSKTSGPVPTELLMICLRRSCSFRPALEARR